MFYRPLNANILRVLIIVGALAALAVMSLPVNNPAFAQEASTIEYAENGMGPVATYTAMDPESAAVMWSLSGDDAGDFMIANGVLSFKKSPDYETPKGGSEGDSNTYMVTVRATDETMNTGEKVVMVTVTNVDEPGMVTLSAVQPQAGTDLTATLTDPDGNPSDQKWQWARSTSMNGSYSDISDADSMTYGPASQDTGYYLMAKVTYEDDEGASKAAMMKSANMVQAIRSPNKAPEFTDDDADATGNQTTREVTENTPAGRTVGDPVRADAQDGDVLTYTLMDGGNGDSASFDINWATGQILTKGDLDADGDKSTYEVVVRATDPAGLPQASPAVEANSDEITVTITVTGVDEPPVVSGDDPPEFNETNGDITSTLASYTAIDPEGDTPITWTRSGADGSKFTITEETGALQFKEPKPDYENPTDANGDNVYEVTVVATAAGKAGTKDVKVTVGNENEAGVVTLNKTQPRVGIAVTASLSDPDGRISGLTWQWESDNTDIQGATSDTYIPKTEDVGKTLEVTASYTDGHGPTKTAMGSSANMVDADTRNKAPMFEDQDTETDGDQTESATREVAEDTKANSADDTGTDNLNDVNDNIGMAVTATDTKADGTPDPLIYTLGGPDAALLRVRDNGQIEVGTAKLDYETKQTYMVTVMAEDSFGLTASIMVTIAVTDVDEDPDVSGASTIEYAENGMGAVATYTAMDPESAAVMWSLGGVDADDFTIANGVLSFKKSPDYETPKGGSEGDSNTYMVTVRATDETMNTGEKVVMVTVTNVDEPGMVTLSAVQPQAGTDLTATLTDPDGNPSDQKWQWARSTSMNGSYSDISDADSMTYGPASQDTGYYLMAKVTYEDDEGASKAAMMKSANMVQAIRSPNKAPEFTDDDADATGNQTTREVTENTPAGRTVGDPVRADAQDGDVLTYTLMDGGNGDSASFDINWATGQILTKGDLDAEEGDATYEVVVRATDPAGLPQASPAVPDNSDEITVTITVTGVDEPPVVSGDDPPEFNETNGDITSTLASYTAIDPEGDTPITWTRSGADGSKFTITEETGALQFKEPKPDYENPTDANGDNVYEVTVVATAAGKAGTKDVKVTVGNENEAGVVTLNKTQPRVGIAVTASLSDPDGRISGLTWQWESDNTDIQGATSDTYTPKTGDVGNTLEATASYTDGHGSGKTAMESSANDVAVDTRNKAPAFADQDTDTEVVENETAARKVEENTKALAGAGDDDAIPDAAGDNVGMAITATDLQADGSTPEPLMYTLSGPDAGLFRVRDNGQIEVGSGTKLDYETRQTYMVTLMAEDSFGASASIMVTIEVTDVDEAPEISEGGLAITGPSSIDYGENGMDAVATYTASGPDAASATWTLDDDAGAFSISSGGELTFNTSPDYEAPASADMDNTYMVTVMADDGTYMVTHNVTVTVTNVDEPGMVALSNMSPLVGDEVMATLSSDPDGMISAEMWQWSRSMDPMDMTSWMDIMGADMASYTAMAADDGYYLQATVTYTDPEGAGKTAMAMTANPVTAVMDQPGTVSLSPTAPQVGDEVTASLSDPDGGETGMTWQWSRSMDMTTWTDIADANSDTYMAMETDDGYYLRATVSYTDGHGAGKSAMMDTASAVGASLVDRYDTDGNGLDKDEVIAAINDYLFGDEDVAISKAQVIELINLYLFG